jgi:hypothetical protein
MKHRILALIGWLTIGAALPGCNSAEEPVVNTAPLVAPVPPTTADATQPAANTLPAPEPATPEPAEPTPAAVASFVPPFPDRFDLFEPPKRAESMARRADETGETVELMGFINVNEPRVILSIDGVISSVPEGGEKYGVQVISIQPPKVVLQRGRDRWPATLE